jgi:hypothetical protein
MPVTSGSERRIVSLAVYGDEVPGVLAAMGAMAFVSVHAQPPASSPLLITRASAC